MMYSQNYWFSVIAFTAGLLARFCSYILEVGKGNAEKSEKVAGAAQFAYIVLTLIGVAVFFVLTIIALFKGELRTAAGWITQIAVLAVTIYGSYYNNIEIRLCKL